MKERTLAILKPDCVRRRLTGKVLDRILEAGFDIVGMKLVRLTEAQARQFYAVHRERPFYPDLVRFMSSGESVVLVLEKENAVAAFRELIGATDPKEAAPGTIRYAFAANKQENIVHGSDSPDNARKEIAFFFSEAELITNQQPE
ncbi:MAG: nucleoside-diphosphate kinase [candidate division KSB1 bacterium]|nr:nucleoside-diphosphate kinase [candidate division KSB1 bacterium]